MKIAPGLHRVGNDIIACYLVDTPDGVLLVDAGIAGQWSDLLTELASMGRSTADLRGVVLTHGDEDHIGFAERLRSSCGIPVWVHEADAGRARGEGKPETGWGRVRLGAVLGFLWYAARHGGLKTEYLREVQTFTDGEVLDLPGHPRVIAMPGHSPGSVAIHVPAVDAVFVGDALTTRNVLTGSLGPAPAPFTDEPELAAASMHGLAAVNAKWVLPGHGSPWADGTQAAVRAYAEQVHPG
jgi:glyoxylase-like metal-dependent hydrolase (beta-lactamase superfamily II)